jgi:hypothetical protein
MHSRADRSMFCSLAQAQEPQSNTAVPKVVRFNSSFHSPNSPAAPSVESVTLAVYSEQPGGAPLWFEIQNVSVEAKGSYSVLMGRRSAAGFPWSCSVPFRKNLI